MSDITFLELFPVVVALNIWGADLKNNKILFHIDNMSVAIIINKKSSKSPRVMTLVRKHSSPIISGEKEKPNSKIFFHT